MTNTETQVSAKETSQKYVDYYLGLLMDGQSTTETIMPEKFNIVQAIERVRGGEAQSTYTVDQLNERFEQFNV